VNAVCKEDSFLRTERQPKLLRSAPNATVERAGVLCRCLAHPPTFVSTAIAENPDALALH
jgi:hypothetical protein